MRKDKGLNGDLDRLPLLTWIMFLKFLDDLEHRARGGGGARRQEVPAGHRGALSLARLGGQPAGHHRRRAARLHQSGRSGAAGRKKGPGLFAYLRSLTSSNGDDRRDVIATVFRGVDNRMKSGYLLRDVINKVADIHFTSSDELHTLGALYEIHAARDARRGGRLRRVLHAAACRALHGRGDRPAPWRDGARSGGGTGGFLVEAFNHLEAGEDRRGPAALQERTLFGCEPKPLPYLLGQMNLLLHGLDAPQIDPGNALRFKLSEIGEKDRVDVILTNPPFGGEEEKGIQGNFPEDRQTAETALLFLQLIMRKLHRQPDTCRAPARAAVVVPNGTLFGDGVCARIKEELLKEFNLHTIVRLPNGVFAPYTSIPTNILFFDRSGPTKEVWYYEQPLPEGRKNYTKTAPIQFEEFAACIAWWKKREENERAWKVPACGAAREQLQPRPQEPAWEGRYYPPAAGRDRCEHPRERGTDRGDYGPRPHSVGPARSMRKTWPLVKLGEVLKERDSSVSVTQLTVVNLAGVYSFGRGLFGRGPMSPGETSYKFYNRLVTDDFVISIPKAWEGAIARVTPEFEGWFLSPVFPTFRVNSQNSFPGIWSGIANESPSGMNFNVGRENWSAP